jgi:hypothetical protein
MGLENEDAARWFTTHEFMAVYAIWREKNKDWRQEWRQASVY